MRLAVLLVLVGCGSPPVPAATITPGKPALAPVETPPPPPAPIPPLPPPVPVSKAAVIQLVTGDLHTCALHADGAVSCWGSNGKHTLGIGEARDQPAPVRVPGVTDATAIGADGSSTCIRRADDSIACWGELAPRDEASAPTAVPMTGAIQLAGRCTRTSSHVECLSRHSQVVTIADADDAIDLASAGDDGCVVHKNGTVGCWHAPDDLRPIAGVRGAVQVAIGAGLACARLRGGDVSCWDWLKPQPIITMRATPRGQQPKLRTFPATPKYVMGGATSIVAGGELACAVDRRGLACWRSGQRPTRIPGIEKVVSVAVGAHSCVARGDRDVACWGSGMSGQLGIGWTEAQPRPTEVPGITDAVSIAASISPGTGSSQYTAAVLRDGSVVAWGELRPGSSPDGSAIPRPVLGLHKIKKLVAGIVLFAIDRDGHLWNSVDLPARLLVKQPVLDATTDCAIDATHHVACWGNTRWTNDEIAGPDKGGVFWSVVPDLDDAVELATGRTGCARKRDGRVACFANRKLELVDGLEHAIAFGGGSYSTCVLREDHRVACSGQGGSWLVNGTPMKSSNETEVHTIANLAQVSAIGVGADHACAVLADTTVSCWGDNRDGQLGDGTRTSRTAAQVIPDLTDVIEVTAGALHSCAVLRDGHVRCWGATLGGEVGTYRMENVEPPANVGWP